MVWRMYRADSAGFLYIASVSVIPELLAESRSGTQALKEVSTDFIAINHRSLVVCRHGIRRFLHGEQGILCWGVGAD